MIICLTTYLFAPFFLGNILLLSLTKAPDCCALVSLKTVYTSHVPPLLNSLICFTTSLKLNRGLRSVSQCPWSGWSERIRSAKAVIGPVTLMAWNLTHLFAQMIAQVNNITGKIILYLLKYLNLVVIRVTHYYSSVTQICCRHWTLKIFSLATFTSKLCNEISTKFKYLNSVIIAVTDH